MAKTEYAPIGEWDGREYYIGAPSEGDKFFAWRVPAVREAIRAQEGWRIISADYSQIEVKLMAFLSQDPWLISAINSVDELGEHKDIHSYMCCEINGYDYAFFYDVLKENYKHPDCRKFNALQLKSMHEEFSVKRGETKCVTFGVPYGAGEETVGKNIRNKKYKFPDGTIGLEPMEVAKRRAKELMDNYFRKAHVLKAWLNQEKYFAQEEGETRSILARRRVYEIPADDDPERNQKLGKIGREAGNHPIQASNADVTKMALVRFYSALRGGNLAGPLLYIARLLMAVHDEIVCTAPEQYVYTVPAYEAEKILKDKKASKEAKAAVIGPVPKLLEKCMADAYNAVTNELYLRAHHVQNGVVTYLKDIWNMVDVGIDLYWTKV